MAHVAANIKGASLACKAHMQKTHGPSYWKEGTATPLVGTEEWLLAAWLEGKDPAARRVIGSVGTKACNLNNKRGIIRGIINPKIAGTTWDRLWHYIEFIKFQSAGTYWTDFSALSTFWTVSSGSTVQRIPWMKE